MKLIKVVFIGSVSCGKHKANTCADCPQGKGANWCHGDCQWVNGRCQQNLLIKKSVGKWFKNNWAFYSTNCLMNL